MWLLQVMYNIAIQIESCYSFYTVVSHVAHLLKPVTCQYQDKDMHFNVGKQTNKDKALAPFQLVLILEAKGLRLWHRLSSIQA